MSAMRILLLLLALVLVAFIAKYTLTGSVASDGGGRTQPAQQLENVREKVRGVEDDLKRAAEKAEKQSDDGR